MAHTFPFVGRGLPAESEGVLRKQNPNTRLTPANKQVGMGADSFLSLQGDMLMREIYLMR